MFYYFVYPSPVGELTIASDEKNIIGLWIKEQKYFGSTICNEKVEKKNIPILLETKKWLDRYFKGEKPLIRELKLKPKGSEFRKLVWKILCEIPYGKVTTYGEIAKKIAKLQKRKTMSAQAVGGAVGHNPISIIIPCHRVIGTNGDLIGYAGGIEVKKKLLQLENADIKKLYNLKKMIY